MEAPAVRSGAPPATQGEEKDVARSRGTQDGQGSGDDGSLARATDSTSTVDHPLETGKHSIEQVADKVKGLLRSDR